MNTAESRRPTDLLARMKATATHEGPAVPDIDGPLVRGSVGTARRGTERRVRFTLDLSHDQHRFLKRFALDSETDASVIARALLTVLEGDAEVAAKVRALACMQ